MIFLFRFSNLDSVAGGCKFVARTVAAGSAGGARSDDATVQQI